MKAIVLVGAASLAGVAAWILVWRAAGTDPVWWIRWQVTRFGRPGVAAGPLNPPLPEFAAQVAAFWGWPFIALAVGGLAATLAGKPRLRALRPIQGCVIASALFFCVSSTRAGRYTMPFFAPAALLGAAAIAHAAARRPRVGAALAAVALAAGGVFGWIEGRRVGEPAPGRDAIAARIEKLTLPSEPLLVPSPEYAYVARRRWYGECYQLTLREVWATLNPLKVGAIVLPAKGPPYREKLLSLIQYGWADTTPPDVTDGTRLFVRRERAPSAR